MIHPIPIMFDMLKFISKVCPPLLRWHYTSKRLDQFIKMDVSSSGERVNYNFSSQEGSCWLTATNLSPFDFTIDRMEVEIIIDGGACFTCQKLMPEVLKATGNQQMFVKGTSPMLAEVAQRAKEGKRARIEIQAFVISSIRTFTIRRSISDVGSIRVLV